MKRLGGTAAILLAVAALIVLMQSVYVVHEWDQVVLTQFGDPVGDPITEPGLHFRKPFLHRVNRFDKRILEWDGDPNQIPTADKRFIWVDTTARWRITDPLGYLQSVGISEADAQTRLDDILDSNTRDQISAHRLAEVVRLTNRVLEVPRAEEESSGGSIASEETLEKITVGRDKIVDKIVIGAKETLPELGISLVDLRIKRINYIKRVQLSVFARMKSERERIAERYRSEGEGRKAEIMGNKERDEKEISSDAERQALELMATADAEAARIYAEAYDQDPEFYAFWRTLESYAKVLGDNHTLVISPDSDLYRHLMKVK
jgi:membrane protease subunit HflC